MKLVILSTATYPSQMANRVHLLNMANSFANNGIETTIFARNIHISKEVKFHIKNFFKSRAVFLVASYVLTLRREVFDVVYIREPRVLLWYRLFSCALFLRSPKVVYEVHDMPRDRIEYLLALHMDSFLYKMVTITQSLKDDLCAINDKLLQRTIVLPDGVDPETFDIEMSQKEARQALDLPQNKKIVVYTGSLYQWKGVHLVRDVALRMPETLFLFVGGRFEPGSDFYETSKVIPNVVFVGYVEQAVVCQYLKSADVLVLPNTAQTPLSNKYTSPLKLFEYMMSRRPIVASRTESITEIVSEQSAYLFTPDDVDDLTQKVKDALEGSDASLKAERAYALVSEYVWDTRAKRLQEFINF